MPLVIVFVCDLNKGTATSVSPIPRKPPTPTTNFGKDGKQEPVIAKVSQETLADMIGTTRSRVSHFMNKFRQLGYIDYNGDLEVHSSLLDARKAANTNA